MRENDFRIDQGGELEEGKSLSVFEVKAACLLSSSPQVGLSGKSTFLNRGQNF